MKPQKGKERAFIFIKDYLKTSANSITIKPLKGDVDYLSETIIEIKGTHSYEGIMGKQYTGYAFKANVRELGNDRFLVTFEKQSIKLLSRKKYWERTSREIAYSE